MLYLKVSRGSFSSRSYRVRATFFFAAKTKILMKDEFGYEFPVLFRRQEVISQTAEGKVNTCIHWNIESTRVTCVSSVCGDHSGQSRGVYMIEEEDNVHNTVAVISSSLKWRSEDKASGQDQLCPAMSTRILLVVFLPFLVAVNTSLFLSFFSTVGITQVL